MLDDKCEDYLNRASEIFLLPGNMEIVSDRFGEALRRIEQLTEYLDLDTIPVEHVIECLNFLDGYFGIVRDIPNPIVIPAIPIVNTHEELTHEI